MLYCLFSQTQPVDETIEILMEKAFKDHWFNKEYDLNITKTDLQKPSFFNSKEICTNMVGVALGCPLGPLMGNAVMCNVQEQIIDKQNKIPAFYN